MQAPGAARAAPGHRPLRLPAHRNLGGPAELKPVMQRLPRILFIAALALLALAAPAHAAKDLLVGMADDGVTQRSPTLGALTVPQWGADGVDVARVMVIWSYVAPGKDAVSQPAGFDPADPDDPAYAWGDVDRTVAQLRAAGITPLIAITGPGPIWGSSVPSLRDSRYKPDPVRFAAFARAVARRYAAATDQYVLWNEPNIDQWLKPQFDCVAGRCTPAAPAIYRSIALKAIPAIKAGDPGARVYFPALAPRGAAKPRKRNDHLRPLPFLRALGCVDAKNRREHRSTSCRSGFKAIDGDGIAYHPHSVLSAPDRSYPDPETASFADLRRLFTTVDAIQKAGGFLNHGSRTAKFDFYFSEFGYQTNPPDPSDGVSYAEQSRWLQQATYLAWRMPRVRLLTQYLWRDDPVGSRGQGFSGWQSGLYGYDGRPKPFAKAFPNPFWVDLPRGRRTATLWGQVRPGGAASVTVQSQRPGSKTWSVVKTLTTDANGYFSFTRTVAKATTFRFQYPAQTGGQTSDPPAPGPTTGGVGATAAGPLRLVTSSAWTVKPVAAHAARRHR